MPSYDHFEKLELLLIQEKEISYYLLAGIVSVSHKSKRIIVIIYTVLNITLQL